MQSATLKYKLIKKIKDERFDVDRINAYELLVHVGARDLQVGVVDPDENRMLLLEDFVFPALSSREALLETLEVLFDDHALLKAGFWKTVKVSIKNNKFVQVPEVLFVKEAREEYLRFNASIDAEREYIQSVTNKRSKAVTVFSIPKDISDWFNQMYPRLTVTYVHQAAALIEGVSLVSENRKDNPLYIFVDRFRLHILSARQGKLIYYNQFVIRQFSEYLKYIMLVMKTLNLRQETTDVVLWGYIGKNSPHYNEFYKYISKVIFGYRPRYLRFGYMFDELQDHHFFDLYAMHLLEAQTGSQGTTDTWQKKK